MEENSIIVVEKEYNDLLRHAVEVIDTARTNIARQVSATASNTYWEIGKLLHKRDWIVSMVQLLSNVSLLT